MIRSPSSGCVWTIFRSAAGRRPGFASDSLGIPRLPASWTRAELEVLQRVLVESELPTDPQREIRDPAGVCGRVLVVRLERVGQRFDSGHERALEALVARGICDRELRLLREAAEQRELPLSE